MRVTLALDPSLGESLVHLDRPLWVCDSPLNRPMVERLWSQPAPTPTSVTILTALGPTPEATCIETLATVDAHHPGWTELVVLGVVASPVVRASFAPFGPGRLLETPNGFTFVRASGHTGAGDD